MKPELIERTQNGSETYERYKLPCGTMLQKTTTPNPKSTTPSARYRLRGRYATNKTVDHLLAKIEALPDDPARRDESQHMSAHFVAQALMHRAARNPGTMRELRNEANDALNKARAAGRAAGTARAAAPASAAPPVQEPEPEPNFWQLANRADRLAQILHAAGYEGKTESLTAAELNGERYGFAVTGNRGGQGYAEGVHVNFLPNRTEFFIDGKRVGHDHFMQWTKQTQGRRAAAPQEELPTTVRLDLPQDDAQPTLAALRTLVGAACGQTVPAQALAQAVRLGMSLQQKLEEQLK